MIRRRTLRPRIAGMAKKVYGIRPHVFHIWADEVIEAVEMQHIRILGHELPPNVVELSPDDLSDTLALLFLRQRIDVDFYFSSMRRLLRTAEQAGAEGYGSQSLRAAMRQFNAAVPGLVNVRDAAEHRDDWVRKGLTRSEGLTSGGGVADAIFTQGQDMFHIALTTGAARSLYGAIKATVPSGVPEVVVAELKPGEAARAIREGTGAYVSPDPRRNRRG